MAGPSPLQVARLQERLPNLIYSAVEDAAQGVRHLEARWSDGEIVKKVSRYMCKAANDPELFFLPYEEMCKELVQRTMRGYCAACNEAGWFYEIELVPVFAAVINEIAAVTEARVFEQVAWEILQLEYHDCLERCLLDKAMWESVRACFKNEKVQSKVFTALSKSYWPNLDEVLAASSDYIHAPFNPREDLRFVEEFTKSWMADSMGRAWCSIPAVNEEANQVLTEEGVVRLFQRLIAPFGEEHPFSCISADLTERIGRPPRDWEFLRTATRDVFRNQQVVHHAGSSKKRRRGGGGGGGGGWGGDDWSGGGQGKRRKWAKEWEEGDGQAETYDEWGEEQPNESAEGAGGNGSALKGHPRCTSAEDCVGEASDQLVRHMLNGEAADMYCVTCWESFMQRNPSLEGVLVEEQ